MFLSFLLICYSQIKGQEDNALSKNEAVKDSTNNISELIDLLNKLTNNSDNEFFKLHCSSIINVINAKQEISSNEKYFLEKFYSTLTNTTEKWSPTILSSYLARKRPFILSWISQADSTVSLAWLLPPKDWDPGKTYWLHGLYAPYENRIEYMTTYLCKNSTINFPFDDGYLILPWARGNKWFEGISETDVWESISASEATFKVDQTKKYLCGFSMGGYGVWYMGHRWAALGIFSGAFSYIQHNVFNADAAQKLKDVPVYITCGNFDYWLSDNRTAYNLLLGAGNQNLVFTIFSGGHESSYDNQKKMGDWLSQWKNENVNSINPDGIPQQFELYQNFPNPFNPSTTICYSLPKTGNIKLEVFNMLGQKIATLVDKTESAGRYQINWNMENYASGIYVYVLKAGSFVKSGKMILMK